MTATDDYKQFDSNRVIEYNKDNIVRHAYYGNGSAMRVSSVGWLFDTLRQTRHIARLTAEVTHNHPEGIDFYMEKDGHRFLMEVKGCTLERDGVDYFPDAPTERGIRVCF